MKKQNVRITIPVTPAPIILLAVAIKAQHTKLGKGSPLLMLDWSKVGPLIDEAGEVNAKLVDMEKEGPKLTERRQMLVDTALIEFVRSCRDMLAGTFRGEFHQLENFGFDVDDTPRPVKKPTATDKKDKAA